MLNAVTLHKTKGISQIILHLQVIFPMLLGSSATQFIQELIKLFCCLVVINYSDKKVS